MVSDLLAVGRWWAVLLVLSFAVLPLSLSLFRGLRDKGWAFAKVLGLALFSWLIFAGATFHLLPFRTGVCWAVLALFALLLWGGFALAPRLTGRSGKDSPLAELRSPVFWRRAALEELVFLAALLLWAYLRATNPALRDLEKFMDHGFVAACLNSDWMPAPDMWFAGEGINYYYYGHYATALLCRLSGIGSAVGYNLMMASTFALTVSLAGALVYDLLGLRGFGGGACTAGGTVGALLVGVGGNGHAFIYGVVLPLLNRLGLADYTDHYWYPDATRFINCFEGSNDNTIHEFPFYSFIVSDLHAHVLDICFVLLFLALSLVWVTRARRGVERGADLWDAFADPAFWLCGVLLGVMAMTNFWDFAIYTIVSLFFIVWTAALRNSPARLAFWGEAGLRLALLLALEQLTALPFSLHFDAMAAGIRLVEQSSPLGQFLTLWYLPLLFFVCYIVWLFLVEQKRLGRWPFAPLGAGCLQTGGSRKNPLGLWLSGFETAELFTLVLYVCGFGLIVGPELLYIQDIYPSAPRANTMFKLTYQAFILFGLAMGYSFVRWWVKAAPGREAPRRKLLPSGAVRALLVFSLVIPLCYTPIALGSTYWGRSYQGLDGLAFIQQESPDEAALIQWIDGTTAPDAVIVEAPGSSYTQSCRISMATGRATIVGWHTHEWLWRSSLEATDARGEEVRRLYESPDEAETQAILDKYGVDFVVIGPRERTAYPALNFDKLYRMCDSYVDFGEYTILGF